MGMKAMMVATDAEIGKCPHCRGIHLIAKIAGNLDATVIMDPDQWADMFMADEDFRREVTLRLKSTNKE